jgi:hypothetical protein
VSGDAQFGPAEVLAIAAVIVAVLALVATVWQGWIARQHSRMSVRPALNYVDMRDSPAALGLAIVNHGLGPAIVDGIEITVDGRRFEQMGSEYKAFVAHQVHNYGANVQFQSLTSGLPIPVGQPFVLLKLQVPPKHDEWLLAAKRFLSRIELRIAYSSMYGERYTLRRSREADA